MNSNYPSITSDVCQILPLGDWATAMINEIFPDYPKYEGGTESHWHIIICDDVSAYFEYLSNLLVDNNEEYTPLEFVFDLDTSADAEKNKSHWKFYTILEGAYEKQKLTLKCFLRFFERHVVNTDHIFNFDSSSLNGFLEDGVTLNADVIEGNIGEEKTRAEVLKAIAQDSCALVIGFYQPVEIKNRHISFPDKVALGMRNIDDALDAYDNIRQKEGKKLLNVRRSYIECEDGKPETIVMSILPCGRYI